MNVEHPTSNVQHRMKKRKRSQVPGLGFKVEGKSNTSDLIRTWHKISLEICDRSMACSVVRSDECGLADGISIFRQG